MQREYRKKQHRHIHKDKIRVCVLGPYCENQLCEVHVTDHFLD